MQGDLDKRLRERNKVYEAEDGHRSIRTKTNDEIYAERLEAADTLAAVREWAEKDPIPYAKEKALALDGTNGYIEAQVDVLDIILDRSDTDE